MSGPLQALQNLMAKGSRRMASRSRHAVKAGGEGVNDVMTATRRASEGVRDRGVNLIKALVRAVRRPLRQRRRRQNRLEEQREFDQVTWGIERELEEIGARGRLVVVGPWFSEVGFETLYWIPFLHWVKAALRLESSRVVAVSRGGVGAWYAGLADRYLEIWDDFDPAEFSRRNAARGTTKQHEVSNLDRDVLAKVAARLGTSDFDVIHPSLMYRLFTLYWSGHRPMSFVDTHTRFVTHDVKPIIDPALLPREYLAVKFYAARSLPDSPEMRERLRGMVRAAAGTMPVVLLDTGLVLEDDHADYALGGDRIISAKPWMTPQNNLGVQTQIVAGAKGFLGTCGSIAWMAPRLGVDTSALYVDPKWLHAHLAVAMRAYFKLNAGTFAAADLRAIDSKW